MGLLRPMAGLSSLLPSRGLERGSVYCLGGDASLSLLATLVSSATQDGSWLSLVNLQHVGLLALHEYGVALHRTVSVSVAHDASWGAVVGALVDGFDLVAVSAPQCSSAEARRITARVKAQSSVLFVVGAPGPFSPHAAFSATTQKWQFTTHAVCREVQVQAQGKRVHGPRSCVAYLPNTHGSLSSASP